MTTIATMKLTIKPTATVPKPTPLAPKSNVS